MSTVSWNDDQKEVIRHRSGNLLVSAAAGSGKTAVMIERLVQMITDPLDPVDLDELLVMTFTNAAASQMRDKLGEQLKNCLMNTEDPQERNHLFLQLKKLKNAHVMTIHAFCLECIREFVTRTPGLDPGFRIADETEASLLKSDVLEEVLEECYQETGDPQNEEARRFLRFADAYSGSRQDQQLEILLLSIHSFLESQVDPDAWMQKALDRYRPENLMHLEETPWYSIMEEAAAAQAELAADLYRKVLTAFEDASADQTHHLIPRFYEILENLKAAQQGAVLTADQITIARMDYKLWKEDPEKKDEIQALYDQAKKAARTYLEIRSEWISDQEAENLGRDVFPALEGLVWVESRFRQAYQDAKQERGIADFQDLEHYALQILQQDGHASKEAEEIRSRFRYICIDEYQDSNDVQERVINLIARQDEHGPCNVFMVGDVKQSIYKFREARPELFLHKQNTYPDLPGAGLIRLRQNFRSRAEILEAVNAVFRKLMYLPVGEIEYNQNEALVPGRVFPSAEEGERVLSSWPVLYRLSSEMPLSSRDASVAEADFTARKIRDLLLSGLMILGENGTYRPVRRRDIAILLRTAKTQATLIQDALAKYEIPSFSEITTGFYQSKEIQFVLNLLRIIDNPMQDIPLVGVLYSPVFSFTAADLARIRLECGKNRILFDSLRCYSDEGTDTALREKVSAFLSRLENWRTARLFDSVYELIWQLLNETGYYLYSSSAQDGAARRANLDLLMTRAIEYEKGSFTGLFNFLRYIEKMEDQSRDEVTAMTSGEEEDVVRIMSIHKSKGLEFPIVFVCGLGHGMNRQDTNNRILLDPELGIGAQRVDPDGGFYYESLPHQALKEKKFREMLAEEMRVLYVALTRAGQALYLVGYQKDQKNPYIIPKGERMEASAIRAAANYMDWLLPIVSADPAWRVTEVEIEPQEEENLETSSEVPVPEKEEKSDLYSQLDERFSWTYPDAWKNLLPTRVSVSQLKKAEQPEPMLSVAAEDPEPGTLVLSLSEASSDANPATLAGTAIHKALSLLDFQDLDGIEKQMQELKDGGLLSEEEWAMIPMQQMLIFAESPLARRMRDSENLLREQPFILNIPLWRIRTWVPGWLGEFIGLPEETEIMVQGIIDCCFVENGRWIVVDYKSDRRIDALRLDQYGRQLNLYAYALETITHRTVSELMLYQTRTGNEIPILRQTEGEEK